MKARGRRQKGVGIVNSQRLTLSVVCSLSLFIAACGMSQVSSSPVTVGVKPPIRSIAMMPGGGLLADAVSVELLNRGFAVIDPSTTSSMMVRLNLNEIEITRPEGLGKLREQGIDAVLSVKAAGSYDDQPQSASARMTSTVDAKLIAGVTWQNGFGGQAGSIMDRVMRQGLNGAASEIANGLAKQIRS